MSKTTPRILLVEDNPLDARMVTRALGTDGAFPDLTHVTDLASAREACSAETFDAILLDLSLPDGDHLVSLDALLAMAPATPVIVLTGLNDPDAAIAAVERGAQDFLDKGTMTPELITRALRYAMARHHTESELRRTRILLESMNTREEIARDLHDTVIQRLFALGMQLQGALAVPDRSVLVDRVDKAIDEIDGTIRELRQAIFGLQQAASTTLDDRIRELADRHLGDRTSCTIDAHHRFALNDEVTHDLLAMLNEALANVAQHAKASEVQIHVVHDDDLVVTVRDDGVGLGANPDAAQDPKRGNGLANLATRARRHGGSVQVTDADGGGTLVRIVLSPTS